MRFRRSGVLVVTIGLSACRPAAEGEAGANPEAFTDPADEPPQVAARAIGAVAACSICHGGNGEGNATLGAPRIGGMESWYIARQLRHFNQGIRATTDEDVYGSQMRAIALTLTTENAFRELGDFYSNLTPPEAPDSITGDTERGEELYTVCIACHMEDGTGSAELDTPSMVGQYDWYLVRQLENYRRGIRGSNPGDEYGAEMAPIVEGTLQSHQDVLDVVAYINTL